MQMMLSNAHKNARTFSIRRKKEGGRCKKGEEEELSPAAETGTKPQAQGDCLRTGKKIECEKRVNG
jgi:hypothetical protein